MSNKLKPEVKAAWVSALRSGQYKQGRGVLRRILNSAGATEYCCLGVLCEISGTGAWDRGAPFSSTDYRAGLSARDHSAYMPPAPVDVWAFGNDDPGKYLVTIKGAESGRDRAVSLQDLNDKYGYTFAQIADLIEEQL